MLARHASVSASEVSVFARRRWPASTMSSNDGSLVIVDILGHRRDVGRVRRLVPRGRPQPRVDAASASRIGVRPFKPRRSASAIAQAFHESSEKESWQFHRQRHAVTQREERGEQARVAGQAIVVMADGLGVARDRAEAGRRTRRGPRRARARCRSPARRPGRRRSTSRSSSGSYSCLLPSWKMRSKGPATLCRNRDASPTITLTFASMPARAKFWRAVAARSGIHLHRQQHAVGRQGQRHAGRRIADGGADLQDAPGAERNDQRSQQPRRRRIHQRQTSSQALGANRLEDRLERRVMPLEVVEHGLCNCLAHGGHRL